VNATVDAYIDRHTNFSDFLKTFRALFLTTELEETVKWGMPTYTMNGKNVVGIGSFKSHCGIWFFQGVFLKDTHKVLHNAQERKTRAMRQWKFTDDAIIDKKLILQYVNEAIDNCKKGLHIKPAKKPLIVPAELQSVLDNDSILAAAFNNLTLTKKREFSEYIASAKRETTKLSRLEKIAPMILTNKGLNDKYRNC